MILAAAGLMLLAQVADARVTVTPAGDDYAIVAEYEFATQPDSLVLDAIQLRGVELSVDDTSGLSVSDLGGLLRVTLVVPATTTLRIAYRVTGSTDRLPIFVPNVPTTPGSSEVSIVVQDAADVSLTDAFPRFSQRTASTVVAEPANLPSFIILPSRGRISRARVADGLVVTVLVFASVFWLVRRRRSVA